MKGAACFNEADFRKRLHQWNCPGDGLSEHDVVVVDRFSAVPIKVEMACNQRRAEQDAAYQNRPGLHQKFLSFPGRPRQQARRKVGDNDRPPARRPPSDPARFECPGKLRKGAPLIGDLQGHERRQSNQKNEDRHRPKRTGRGESAPHNPFTIPSTIFFASANNIIVLSRKNSSFSTPA